MTATLHCRASIPAGCQKNLRRRPTVTTGASLLTFLMMLWLHAASVTAQQSPDTSTVELRGHLSDVVMGDFAARSNYAATVSFDQTLRFWDTTDGREIRVCEGHTGPLYSLATGPRGLIMATGAQDNTVRIWEIPQTRPLLAFPNHQGLPTGVSVAPSGRWMLSADKTGNIFLRDRRQPFDAAGVQLADQPLTRQGHSDLPLASAWRTDDQLFATSDQSGRILFWSPLLEGIQGELRAGASAINGIGFSSNNQQLYSCSADGILRVWQMPAPPQRMLPTVTAQLTAISVAANQPTALGAAKDGTLRLYDVNNGTVSRDLMKQPRTVLRLSQQPAGQLVATVDDQSALSLISLADGTPQGSLAGHQGTLQAIAFHPGSQQLFSTGDDGLIRLWNLPKPAVDAAGHTQPPTEIVSAPNGQWFATGASDNNVRIWTAAGQAQRELPGHQQKITALAARFDSAQLASADASGRIHLWNPGNGQLEATLLGTPGSVQALGFARNNAGVLSADSDGLIRHWKLPVTPPQDVTGHTGKTLTLAVNADHSLVLSGSEDKTVRLWNFSNGQQIRSFDGHDAVVRCVCFSPDGTLVAAAGDGGRISVWSTTDGTLRHRRVGVQGTVTGIALTAGNRSLIAATSAQTLAVWALPGAGEESPEDATPVGTARLPDAGVTKLLVSPDGNTLYTCSGSGSPRIWPLNEGSLTGDAPSAGLNGRAGIVSGFAVSSDGKFMASCSEDGTVFVWDLGTPVAAPRTLKLSGPARSVSISRDGSRIVAGLDAGLSALIDTTTMQVLQHFMSDTQRCEAVAISGDGMQSFAAGDATIIKRFTAAVDRVYAGADAAITELLVLAEDAGIAAVSAAGQRVFRWKTTGEELPALETPVAGQTHLATSPTGAMLLATGPQGKTTLWELAGQQATEKARFQLSAVATSVSLNSDGTRIALTDNTKTITVASTASGKVLEQLAFQRPMTGVVWSSADGRSLSCIGQDNNVTVSIPALARFFPVDAVAQSALGLSPDGSRFWSGGTDGVIRQWVTSEGKLERELKGHTAAVTDLSLSPNSQLLVSSSLDKTVRIWNAADGQLQVTLEHPVEVTGVSIRSDSTRLATTSVDGIVRLWDLAGGVLLETYTTPAAPTAKTQWLNDGQTLISCAGTELQVNRTSVLRALPLTEADAVAGMRLLAGGAQALTISSTGVARLTDTNNGNLIRQYETPQEVRAIATRVDNQAVALGMADGLVQVVNPGNGTVTQELQFESGVVSLAWSTDNQKLAVACEDATLSVYGPVVPPATAEPGVSLYLHEQIRTETPLLTLEFTDSNQQLLGTQSTGVVTQWKTAQPTALRQLNHGGAVYAVAIAADGTTIVSGSADQTVRIWDAITGQQRFQMRGHVGAVHSLAVSPDGALVLTSGADRTIRLWDAVGGRQLKQLATTSETMYSVAIHPDGQIAAAAGADRQVHLYQLLTGAEIRTLNGHTDYIHSIRFSPDGKRLMSYGYAGQLRIWNVADGKELFSDRIGRVGNYASYAFDGSRALLSNGDGSARIFELPGAVR